jgi:YD repeat-containing protein
VLPLLQHLYKAFDAEALVSIAVITLAGVSVLAVNTVILGEFVREGGYPKRSHAPRLIIGVVWAFIAAFAFTLINQPPLPRVEVHGSTTVESGRLLAHADGFWYVYNAADDLIAIRDDNVKTVKYKSEP